MNMSYEERLQKFLTNAPIADVKAFRKALKILIRAKLDHSYATDILVSNWFKEQEEKLERERIRSQSFADNRLVSVNSKY